MENYYSDGNVTTTMNVNEIVFSEATYTKNEFTFYSGDENGCSFLYVDK